ncbi:MAG: crossover junction endodeoxyribonuclease RuvC [Muribaculaceae bacterium]|nr:crossover junction endodeoxyribonuclease RuvC [Muribaculaceae bacterium]
MSEVCEAVRDFERVILGIDPGTNVMGYGVLGANGKKITVVTMGVIRLSKFDSHYLRLRRIHERVTDLCRQYLPDELAIEAPFFGKNVQSMLKLGRAQGVAMAAALTRDIPIAEYEPRKIKQSITGNGAASKEQVKEMLRRMLSIPQEYLLPELDATDALAAAVCHYYESSKPAVAKTTSWKDYIAKNPGKVRQ